VFLRNVIGRVGGKALRMLHPYRGCRLQAFLKPQPHAALVVRNPG